MQQVVIIIFAVILGLAICRKFLSTKEKSDLSKSNPSELKAKYQMLGFIANVGLIVGAAIITLAITKGMALLQTSILANKGTGAIYVVGTTWAAFFLPGMFIGGIVSALIIQYLFMLTGKRMAGDNLEEWNTFYEKNKPAMATWKYVLIFVPVSLLSIALLFLGLNNYLVVTKNDIYYHGYLASEEKQYSFNDVKKIIFINEFKDAVTGQNASTAPQYTIIMKDGFHISTLNLSINQKPIEKKMVHFISNISNIPITKGVHNVDD